MDFEIKKLENHIHDHFVSDLSFNTYAFLQAMFKELSLFTMHDEYIEEY